MPSRAYSTVTDHGDILRQDVDDLYDDLAHMRVWTDDIRYANILRAPQSPPGLPGRICPFHNRVHEWRLVDFEHGQETNVSLAVVEETYSETSEGTPLSMMPLMVAATMRRRASSPS